MYFIYIKRGKGGREGGREEKGEAPMGKDKRRRKNKEKKEKTGETIPANHHNHPETPW